MMLMCAVGASRAANVIASNDLSCLDKSGWHDSGATACWPSSNYIHFASSNFYAASNIFLFQTNFIFTNINGVVTQDFDAVLSTTNIGQTASYKFLVVTSNGNTIVTQSVANLASSNTTALFDARQLRMWDCYNAILERAHVESCVYDVPPDDTLVGPNIRRDMLLPVASFYHNPYFTIQALNLREFKAQVYISGSGLPSNTMRVLSISTNIEFGNISGSWIDPYYATNILNTINDPAATNGIGLYANKTLGLFDRFQVPTNFGYWVPANLSWVENVIHKQIETNSFLSASNTIVKQVVTNATGTWPIIPEVAVGDIVTNPPISTYYDLDLQGISSGQVSTDYGLDTLRRIVLNKRWMMVTPSFGATERAIQSGDAMTRDDAIAACLSSGTIFTNYASVDIPSCFATLTTNAAGRWFASAQWGVGKLYGGSPPSGYRLYGSLSLENCLSPSDEVLKSCDVYGKVGSATNYTLIEHISSTPDAHLEGSAYGMKITASDFPAGTGTVTFNESIFLEFSVLDYNEGFKYK